MNSITFSDSPTNLKICKMVSQHPLHYKAFTTLFRKSKHNIYQSKHRVFANCLCVLFSGTRFYYTEKYTALCTLKSKAIRDFFEIYLSVLSLDDTSDTTVAKNIYSDIDDIRLLLRNRFDCCTYWRKDYDGVVNRLYIAWRRLYTQDFSELTELFLLLQYRFHMGKRILKNIESSTID